MAFYLLIIDISQILKFTQCLYAFFYKKNENSDEAQCSFFCGFQYVLIFCETFLRVNDENNAWRKYFTVTLYDVQELHNSLRVILNFWFLIMASTIYMPNFHMM